MKLLVLTQKVNKNDPILGFFHEWLLEFSKLVEQITVICLEEGEHDLPVNIRVLSLGKEVGVGRFTRLQRFYQYIYREKDNYDNVFVHMNPEYVVLGGLWWKSWHKKIAFWYVHRQVNFKLRIATWFADIIFTSTKESFRLESSKVHYVGHGIDVNKFPIIENDFSGPIELVHLGRITKIKNIDVTLRAAKLLLERGVPLDVVRLVGKPVTEEDRGYKKNLQSLARELGLEAKITFDESNDDFKTFHPNTISINAAPNGGMDKAVLGSLAARRPTFVTNVSFKTIFSEAWKTFSFEYRDPDILAYQIEKFYGLSVEEQKNLITPLAEKVRTEYATGTLVKKLVELMYATSR